MDNKKKKNENFGFCYGFVVGSCLTAAVLLTLYLLKILH